LTYNEDRALYLELMDAAISAAQSPFPQAEAESRALLELSVGTGTGLNKFRSPRTKVLFPALTAYVEAVTRGNAQSEAALTAIAIERYRRQQGEPPERLGALVPQFLPQLPVDPFDGQPLRYVVQPDQYLLYSVGQDRVDNGGPEDSLRDIVMRVRKAVP
jgi:hypothetical protein